MSKILYGIYGASGFGREVMPIARQKLLKLEQSDFKLVFIDDNPKNLSINGCDVVTFEEFLKIEASNYYAGLAIANSSIRESLFNKCRENNIHPWSVFAENIVIMDEVEIGESSILSPFVTITSNVKIGKCFHANIYSYVAHDCIIGDYVTFAPSVKCNGNVHIEDHVYIGTGAIIRQGKTNRPIIIGKNAVVAAGAVVTKNVPPGLTVFGNPAVALSKANLRNK